MKLTIDVSLHVFFAVVSKTEQIVVPAVAMLL
jgi:hypothetical protein